MKNIIIATIIVLTMSCQGENKETETKNSSVINELEGKNSNILKNQLDAKKALFEASASEEKIDAYEAGIADVKDSGIMDNAKNIGEKAINFKLKNAQGKEVSLENYLEKGPVVLTWYRGGWCPYCNITLNELQAQMPKFEALNTTILALTPELPDNSITTKEKNNIEFEILSDIGNKVGKEYGVVFTLIDEVATLYQTGFGLHEFNGDDSNELPLAATYVIDQNGIIQYAFLNEDYRNRAEPSDILNAIRNLE